MPLAQDATGAFSLASGKRKFNSLATTFSMNLRGLIKFALWRDTTMHGEFSAIRRHIQPDFPKIVVDVGANDGFYGSNSYPFIARGWRAVMIEPHPVVFAKLQQQYAGRANVACLNLACADKVGSFPLFLGTDGDTPSQSTLCDDKNPKFQSHRSDQTINVAVDTLSHVLELQKIPGDIGLLTVDAEGMDYEVLLGLDLTRWRPRVIFTENYESKDAAKAKYLEEHGYQLRERVNTDTLWMTTEILKD